MGHNSNEGMTSILLSVYFIVLHACHILLMIFMSCVQISDSGVNECQQKRFLLDQKIILFIIKNYQKNLNSGQPNCNLFFNFKYFSIKLKIKTLVSEVINYDF